MTTKHLTLIASSRDETNGPRDLVFDGIEPLDFMLPPELEAHEPPEARGLGRDGVRLMVSRGAEPLVSHHRFAAIADALSTAAANAASMPMHLRLFIDTPPEIKNCRRPFDGLFAGLLLLSDHRPPVLFQLPVIEHEPYHINARDPHRFFRRFR